MPGNPVGAGAAVVSEIYLPPAFMEFRARQDRWSLQDSPVGAAGGRGAVLRAPRRASRDPEEEASKQTYCLGWARKEKWELGSNRTSENVPGTEGRMYGGSKDGIAQQHGEMREVSCGWKVVGREDPSRKWSGKRPSSFLMCLEWTVSIMDNFQTEEKKTESEFCI